MILLILVKASPKPAQSPLACIRLDVPPLHVAYPAHLSQAPSPSPTTYPPTHTPTYPHTHPLTRLPVHSSNDGASWPSGGEYMMGMHFSNGGGEYSSEFMCDYSHMPLARACMVPAWSDYEAFSMYPGFS